jgi:hypothetical protein
MVYLIAAVILILIALTWLLGSGSLPEQVRARDPDRPREGHLVLRGLGIFAVMACVLMLAVVLVGELAEWGFIRQALAG